MSTFGVLVRRIRGIEPHPNADRIEFAIVDGYRSIVKKGMYREGDLTVFLPPAAILPEEILRELGFWNHKENRGTLRGKNGDRVDTVKLCGHFSQGICYHIRDNVLSKFPAGVKEGDDVTDILGIKKYNPPVPKELLSQVLPFENFEESLNFDVENWQDYPELLENDEPVVFTEKIHGNCTIITVLPNGRVAAEGFGEKKNIVISSKGLSSQGLYLANNEKNKNNPYIKATLAVVERISQNNEVLEVPLHIVGEVFGAGIQDLNYTKELSFRVFAVVKGFRGQQQYMNWDDVVSDISLMKYGYTPVPEIYRGPYSEARMRHYASGQTTLGGKHIREGIVMVPTTERVCSEIGRVCLKFVSPEYLGRQNGTEYT